MSRPACRFVGEDDGDENKYQNTSCDFAESVSDLEPDEVKNLPAERLIRIKIPVSDGSIKLKCFDVLDLYGWIQSHPGGELFSRECVLTEGQKTRIRNQAETYFRNNNREDEIKQAEQKFNYPQIHREQTDYEEEGEPNVQEYYSDDDDEEEEKDAQDYYVEYFNLTDDITKYFIDFARHNYEGITSVPWPMKLIASYIVDQLYIKGSHPYIDVAAKAFLIFCQQTDNAELKGAVELAAQQYRTLRILRTLEYNLDTTDEKETVIRYIFLILLGKEVWEETLRCFYSYKSILFTTNTPERFYLDCLTQLRNNRAVNAEIIFQFLKIQTSSMQTQVLKGYIFNLLRRIKIILQRIYPHNANTPVYTEFFPGELIPTFKMMRAAGVEDNDTTTELNNLVENIASSSIELVNRAENYQTQQVIDFIQELVIERESGHTSSRKRHRTAKDRYG